MNTIHPSLFDSQNDYDAGDAFVSVLRPDRGTVPNHECPKCRVVKDASHFVRDRKSVIGIQSQCKECRNAARRRRYVERGEIDYVRAAHFRKTYGISMEEYNAMLSKQGHVCAICGKAHNRRLCVDHNHTTGEVRALLCYPCNSAIGLLNDDISVMKAAIRYLKTHQPR